GKKREIYVNNHVSLRRFDHRTTDDRQMESKLSLRPSGTAVVPYKRVRSWRRRRERNAARNTSSWRWRVFALGAAAAIAHAMRHASIAEFLVFVCADAARSDAFRRFDDLR